LFELGVDPPERSLAGYLGLGWIGQDGHEKGRDVAPPGFSNEAP
jgi:hypothetical protein